MASFLDNILQSGIGQQVLNMAGEKLKDGSLQQMLEKTGVGNGNIGSLATGVINVIGLAAGALKNSGKQ